MYNVICFYASEQMHKMVLIITLNIFQNVKFMLKGGLSGEPKKPPLGRPYV